MVEIKDTNIEKEAQVFLNSRWTNTSILYILAFNKL